MCLPCFPWTWTKFEDPLDQLHKAPEQSIWVHDRHGWELQKVVSLGFLFLNLLFDFIYQLLLSRALEVSRRWGMSPWMLVSAHVSASDSWPERNKSPSIQPFQL